MRHKHRAVTIAQRDSLPESFESWLDPDRALPEPSRFWPTDFGRPWWTGPIVLLTVIITYALVQTDVSDKADLDYLAVMFVAACLPLFAASAIALRRWIPATRARWLRKKGRWRDGLHLLSDSLLYVRGNSVTIIERGRLSALRTKQDADQINKREKRDGKHRLRPAIGYRDDRGEQAFLVIDENRELWWSLLAARWDDWRRTGKPPRAVEPTQARKVLAKWLPNIIYLQLLYIVMVLLGVMLFLILADFVDPNTAFIVNAGLGVSMMIFGFIGAAIALQKPLRRWFPNLNVENYGSGYAGLLGAFTMVSVLYVGSQGNAWWQTAFADRIPDINLAEAIQYKGENFMLGLRDVRVAQGSFGVDYGAYQPEVYNHSSRRSETGRYHYVARLVSTRSPETCVYLGAVENDPRIKTKRRSSAERLLTLAPYYREPLDLGPLDLGSLDLGRTDTASAFKKALDDLEGGEIRRCRNMLLEPIADPDALAGEELRKLWWVILALQLSPLVLLSIWTWFKWENRWL
ncbi:MULTISPECIES: hypothetical protein [Thiorhodovibrio]|uniref:hypothetical protein n=1 Tax=Thiorhodovibrio TaxID=61593 RepID=UPI0019126561|nr:MULTISPECIES: hypothetical protein [Thiorhodovibrio]